MRISISSVLTVNILMSILIGLACPVMKNTGFLRHTGLRWPMLFLLLITVRLVFPIEFFYTYSIYFQEVFTTIRQVLLFELGIADVSLKIYEVILLVWVCGIAYKAVKKWRIYHNTLHLIRTCGHPLPKAMEDIVGRIAVKYPELSEVKIVYLPKTSYTPLLMGIRKYTIILSSVSYSESELEYILGHEAMHIRGRDVIWKSLIDFLGIVYWWNPLIGYMQGSLFDMVEINNDLKLTEGMSVAEKEGYLECLCRVVKDTASFDCIGTVSFAGKATKNLERRFDFIVRRVEKSKVPKVIAMFVACAVILLSTCVVFEPSYPAPEGTFRPSDENMYAIYNNGVYDIYYNGEYVYSEKTLDYFPENLIIYKE